MMTANNGAAVKISIVIPVYLGDACLIELHRRLLNSVHPLTHDFEIIFVEDCGPDGSWAAIERIAARDPHVRGVRLSRNFGQHRAITAGLDQASGDWIVTMDCDLQDRPEDIPRLYAEALKGYDMVLARRMTRRDACWKRLSSAAFYAVFSYLVGYRYDGRVGSFRIMSRPVVSALCSMREQLRALGPLSHWVGFHTGHIDVEHAMRLDGRSSYTLRKLVGLATESVVAYSDRPLRLSVGLGFAMAFCALAYGVAVFLRAAIRGIPVPGWSSLIVSVYFIGGLVLLNLGVLGIYLARTFDEAKGRPLYLIAEATPAITHVCNEDA